MLLFWKFVLLLSPFLMVALVGIADAALFYTGRKTISTITREWDRKSYCIPLLIALVWGFIVGGLFVHWFFYRN